MNNNNIKNSLEIGRVINDKWVILEFIARGGMGEVYRAHQLNLKRDVVIKVISTDWLETCADNEEELETGLQRFRNEVQSMAQVRHPNIVQIYDYGSVQVKKTDETVELEYIVMEYIPGNTLRETMSEEGFYPEEDLTADWLSSYFFPVLDGVQALHDHGIVHRDLKPENILMDANTPKIADFGLARSCLLKSVTQSMDVKGTPPYMSPEHFFNFRMADQQADVYSLGKILYEAITGKISSKMKPFQKEKLPSPDTPFFQKIDNIIQYSTTEKKEERMQSVRRFRQDLIDAMDTLKKKPETGLSVKSQRSLFWRNPKWIWAGVAIAIVSMLSMTLWHLFGGQGKSPTALKTSPISEKLLLQPDSGESSPVRLKVPETPGQAIVTKDGATLQFVQGGEITFPQNLGIELGELKRVESFYMDETQVTNHQYVEFLNQNLSRIRVTDGVVRGDNNIWLLLGEVIKGYDPIVFLNNRFKINKAPYASYPVLRITAFGASAYAKFYGRRLPTVEEWLYALLKGSELRNKSLKDTSKTSDEKSMEQMMEQMMRQGEEPKNHKDVLSSKPNIFGIRGMNEKVGEWAFWIRKPTLKNNNNNIEYVILGGIEKHAGIEVPIPSPIIRKPWEAFEEVGFRCVQSAKIQSVEPG